MATTNFKDYAIVIHHCDNDGYLSGTLLRLYANSQGIPDSNIVYFCYNNININELERFIDDMIVQSVLTGEALILAGNISIAPETSKVFKRIFSLSSNVFWFDHHETSLELENEDVFFKNIPGVRSSEYCSSKLIWNKFHDDIIEGFKSRNLFSAFTDKVINLVDSLVRNPNNNTTEERNFLAGTVIDTRSTNPADYFWIDCIYFDDAFEEAIHNGLIANTYIDNLPLMTIKGLIANP